MWHEFRRQSADTFPVELPFEDEPRTAGEIQRHPCLAFIHRQEESIAVYAALVSQRFSDGFAEAYRRVFHSVVLVDVEVASAVEAQAEAAMPGYLLQHVIIEADPGVDMNGVGRVEIDGRADPGFLRISRDRRQPGGSSQCLCDARPAEGEPVRGPDEQSPDAYVLRQLQVGLAIANDCRTLRVQHGCREVPRQQPGIRFATGAAVAFAERTDEHFVEGDALAFEYRSIMPVAPGESFHGERFGAETILVRHHHEAGAGVSQTDQCRYDILDQSYLLERIDLVVRRFLNQPSVAIYEQHFLHISSVVQRRLARRGASRSPAAFLR